jgi:hypothetical protein
MTMQSALQRILILALIGQGPEILIEVLCTLFQHRLKTIPCKGKLQLLEDKHG